MKNLLISSETIHSKDDLFELMKSELPLPEYCGRNLDALHDALSYLREDVRVTVIKDDALVSALSEHTTEILIQMLSDVERQNGQFVLSVKDKTEAGKNEKKPGFWARLFKRK